MLTVRIQEKNHSESIMVLKLKDGSVHKAYFLFVCALIITELTDDD